MRILGVELKGSEALLAAIDTEAEYRHLEFEPKRIKLDDPSSAASVKSFLTAFSAILRTENIDLVTIKGRSKNGKFAGGPDSFKIEGVIQVCDKCDVRIVAPQTVSAYAKKMAVVPPATLTKYQQDAFLTACSQADAQT